MRKFSVVIPSKTASNLEACVKSIRAAGETCRILVADDFPREKGEHPLDKASNYLASCPHGMPMSWLPGQKPFVFGRNVNIGIRAAGEDDVIVMNDDARLLTPGGFTAMVEAVAGQGICSAAITAAVGNFRQMPARGDGLRREGRVLAFICCLIPKEVRDKVGLLDECFVAYGFDDNSYCRRCHDADVPLFIHDGCHVEHGVLPSTFAKEQGRDCRENAKIYAQMYRGRLLLEEVQFMKNLGIPPEEKN